MGHIRPLAVVAALAAAQTVNAWNFKLPPCLSPFRPFVYTGCFEDVSNPDTLVYRSNLDTQNMTVEKCMADCKGNGFRYAGLEYYGECYCGSTVNGKQMDESQCKFPCTGNKSEVCGGNDRLSIYQDTTFLPVDTSTIADYVHLGCYTDDSKLGKTLSWPVDSVGGATLTPAKCLTACKAQGYPFAGVEYGKECYCGVVLANDTSPVDSSQCNIKCAGDNTTFCGGRSRLDLWVAKDLESLEPCGYKPPESSTSSTAPTYPPTSTPPSSTPPTSPTYPPTSTPPSTTSSSSPTYPPTSTPPSSTSSTAPTYPPTTTPPTTTKPPTSTTPTTSLCVSTITVPSTCEYGCGKWCSDDLPDWDDKDGCNDGHSHCKLQVADCLSNAGWPSAMDCFDFAGWCSDIKGYCGGVPKGGKCSKKDCYGKKPPKGGKPPTTTTTKVPCKPTTTSKAPTSTTSQCPIPTVTGICQQPSSSKYGYGPGNPVGGVELPIVSCNDIKSEYSAGNVFKLYTNKESKKCGSYKRPQCSNACADACKTQYDQCNAVYAQGCKSNDDDKKKGGRLNKFSSWRRDAELRGRSYFDYAADESHAKRTYGWGWNDSWNTAATKCKTQYDDCLGENKNVSYKDKCLTYGGGW